MALNPSHFTFLKEETVNKLLTLNISSLDMQSQASAHVLKQISLWRGQCNNHLETTCLITTFHVQIPEEKKLACATLRTALFLRYMLSYQELYDS